MTVVNALPGMSTLFDIPALSIRPPWAHLIIGGWKPCENRTWTTNYRGPLLVHAGKTWDPVGVEFAAEQLVWVDKAKCATGVYLGVVTLVDVHEAADCTGICDGWGADDQFHWVLADPARFDTPIEGRGMLGLYRKNIPDGVRTATAELVRP